MFGLEHVRKALSQKLCRAAHQKPSARPRTQLGVEALESRALPASGVFQNSLGQVVIRGTDQGDTAQVSLSADGTHVVVDLNGAVSEFATATVTKVVFLGGKGDDTFHNNTGIRSLAFGGMGNDTLVGGTGVDHLLGQDGNDVLSGQDGNDDLEGGNGDDQIDGGNGDDQLDGGDGNDVINGEDGNDDMSGDSGNDTLDGGNGNDVMLGGLGQDNLFGAAGNDFLNGCRGRDILFGGSGVDVDGDANDNICDNNLDEVQFAALMIGTSGAIGHAQLGTQQDGDVDKQVFELEIERAAADTTYDVTVDGALVGQITTDANGAGKLQLTDPANLPDISDGSVVAVGDVLHGTFAQAQ